MLYSRQHRRRPPASRALTGSAAASGGRYLTDGNHLYRELGRLEDVPDQLLLEDCYSLNVMLMTRAQARRLRDVTPTGGQRSPATPATGLTVAAP